MAPKRATGEAAEEGTAKRRRGAGAHTRLPPGAASALAGDKAAAKKAAKPARLTAAAVAALDQEVAAEVVHDMNRCAICSSQNKIIEHDDFSLCPECDDTAKFCFPYRTPASLVQECGVNKNYKKWYMSCSDARLGRNAAALEALKPAVVTHTSQSADRTERRFIGLSRTEFIDLFGVAPEVLGLRTMNLDDEFGKPYRAVLMVDDKNPWRYHVISRTRSHAMVEDEMPHRHQTYAEQAEKTFQWVKGPEEKKWSGNLNKAWSFAELQSKVQAYQRQRANQSSSASVEGKDEASSQALGDKFDGGMATSLREADVMTVVTGTPDKRWRTIKVLAGDEENHKRLVGYWIGQLSLSSAMSGMRLGKEKNECLSAADRLARVEAHSFASQLRDHHALVLTAERLQAPFTFWVFRGGPG